MVYLAKHLKGVDVKKLKKAAKIVERMANSMGGCSASEETRKLEATNTRQQKEIEALRKELKAMKKEMEAQRRSISTALTAEAGPS